MRILGRAESLRAMGTAQIQPSLRTSKLSASLNVERP